MIPRRYNLDEAEVNSNGERARWSGRRTTRSPSLGESLVGRGGSVVQFGPFSTATLHRAEGVALAMLGGTFRGRTRVRLPVVLHVHGICGSRKGGALIGQ